MLFTSGIFLIFFPAVAGLHFLVPERFRWFLLLVTSYVFYAWWRPEYLLLLIGVTLIAYVAGLVLDRAKHHRRLLLSIALLLCLSPLLVYKYLGFFAEAVSSLLAMIGIESTLAVPGFILPLGISFFTFQSVGYIFDVYRRKRSAEKHLGFLALFVSFFPQLVAGPIERSTALLPQLRASRAFDDARTASGLRLVLWGFFKKLVIADRLGALVNVVYSDVTAFEGVPLLLATYLFAFQILCDFSAYTDIARGCARVLGVHLTENFRQPYLSSSLVDFWRRWHISLTSWFRDYVYIPLGGARRGRLRWGLAVLVVFLASGLWHGAAWTFVVWGGFHGALYLIGRLTATLRDRFWSFRIPGLRRVRKVLAVVVTFHFVALGWVFFRAESMSDALYVLRHAFCGLQLRTNYFLGLGLEQFAIGVAALGFYLVVDNLRRWSDIGRWLIELPTAIRWALYYALIFVVLFFAFATDQPEFIYFQF